MNGIHDMGGMDGFGPVTPEANEPVFHEAWEGQMMAISRVMGAIGGFGGLFDLAALEMDDPVLVSSTDGVGTKSVLAWTTGRYDTIGIDLVGTADDIAAQGATPLFFFSARTSSSVSSAAKPLNTTSYLWVTSALEIVLITSFCLPSR